MRNVQCTTRHDRVADAAIGLAVYARMMPPAHTGRPVPAEVD
jgi:hypothetical protein